MENFGIKIIAALLKTSSQSYSDVETDAKSKEYQASGKRYLSLLCQLIKSSS